MEIKTVFAVFRHIETSWKWEGETDVLKGIFTSAEKAQAFIDKNSEFVSSNWRIEIVELDDEEFFNY